MFWFSVVNGNTQRNEKRDEQFTIPVKCHSLKKYDFQLKKCYNFSWQTLITCHSSEKCDI